MRVGRYSNFKPNLRPASLVWAKTKLVQSTIETRIETQKADYIIMTELLERAIAELKQLPKAQQDRVAMMILQKIKVEGWLNSSTTMNQSVKPKDKLSSLWQKIDELGTDKNEPTMAEITAMVKEVRSSHNRE